MTHAVLPTTPPTVKGSPPAPIAKVHRIAPFLADPVAAVWDESPRLYLDRARQPWIVMAAEQDPMRTLKGQVAIPRRCLRDLQRVADAGIDFDRLAVAHELDPGALPSAITKSLSPWGTRCTPEAVAHLVGTIPPPPVAGRRLATAMDTIVSQLVDLASTAATTATSASAITDPIVFGVLGPSGPPTTGELAYWFPLTAWRW